MPQGGEALGKEERAAEVFSGEEESAAQHNSCVGEVHDHEFSGVPVVVPVLLSGHYQRDPLEPLSLFWVQLL